MSLLAICTVAFVSGCKSIPNPIVRTSANDTGLPTDAITEVAQYFETQVHAENRTPELASRAGLILDTPEIAQALRSRAARVHLVKELLDSGDMLEQSNGKIAIIRSNAYKNKGTKNDRDRHAMIVISENVDRVILYDSLRKTNNLPSSTRTAVEEIFFNTRVAALEPGQKYRGKDGEILTR